MKLLFNATMNIATRMLLVCKMSFKAFFGYQLVWLLCIVALMWMLKNVQTEHNVQLRCSPEMSQYNGRCDPMAYSGVLATIFGLIYSFFVDRSQINIITRLHNDAIIHITRESFVKIRHRLSVTGFVCQISCFMIAVLITIMGFSSIAHSGDLIQSNVGRFIILCAALVGIRTGRILGSSFTGSAIELYSSKVRLKIQHADEAGGLAYIGRFFFWQSSALLIPIIWAMCWIYLIREIPRYEAYQYWTPYFNGIFLPVLVPIFLLSLFFPMLSFRRIITSWKSRHINQQSNKIRCYLMNIKDSMYYDINHFRRIREISDYLEAMNSLPNWPISATVRKAIFSIVLGSVISAIIPPLVKFML